MRRILFVTSLLALYAFTTAGARSPGETYSIHKSWRSALYPEKWTPADTDDDGRFLHDFSYAGYCMGKDPIPDARKLKTTLPVLAVKDADPKGKEDSTAAIQRVIDAAGGQGGAIVQLPRGVFKISPPEGSSVCLHIRHSNVILRGDSRGKGPSRTQLFCTEPEMRHKQVIQIGDGNWKRAVGSPISIREDLPNRSRTVPVASVDGLSVDDWVVLRCDVTKEFIEAHGMTEWWKTSMTGPMFYRQITGVDRGKNVISIDIPTRYPLLTRDNARVYRVSSHIANVGVEDLAIGMVCRDGEGFGDNDYNNEGTGAWKVHGSSLISVNHVVDSWIRRVATFCPDGNDTRWHFQSNGIRLSNCRNVTVKECTMSNPQYEGGGGNGYGFLLRGNDCLVTQCLAVSCRHAYNFGSMCTSGNVVHRCTSRDARLSSDFHMHLSMANLFDCMTMDGDFLEARVRPYGTVLHGHPTTQSVFWNTHGLRPHRLSPKAVVVSRQFGHGYVIGTRGSYNGVTVTPTVDHERETAPVDFVEGVGQGDSLVPESLYEDQLELRQRRED